MKVLILDQFSSVNPYDLQHRPRPFEDLIREQIGVTASWYRKAEVLEIDPEKFSVPMCTTVLKADEHGYAELWRARWDSSG